MSTLVAPSAKPASSATLPPPAKVQQLHHYAYRAKDAEETRVFYEDILELGWPVGLAPCPAAFTARDAAATSWPT